jgi:oxygen-independent coproporphyrinogen-3 oxidase
VELGLYVHFPWCRARCPYCDFAIAVAPLVEIPHERYTGAILAELAARAPRFPGRTLRTIYFGGGTPALWRPAEIARVIAAARAAFPGEPEEITVEANPNDAAAFPALRAAGANRLSIGAQSFDDEELVRLGRDHDGASGLAALDAARAAGFDNVSLDLIYALPGRTLADWRRTLARAAAAGPEHLSVYQLTIEPATTFGEAARRGKLVPAPDELTAAMFEEAHAALGAAGYEHYEVSAYARAGRRSRHNSSYWRGVEYLGLGNGAHSFWRPAPGRGVRWASHRSVVRWLAGKPSPPEVDLAADALVAEVTEQDERALAEDALWLGLRTSDGVPRALCAGREERALALAAAGLVEVSEERVRPTPRGLLFADEIAARLLY